MRGVHFVMRSDGKRDLEDYWVDPRHSFLIFFVFLGFLVRKFASDFS